MKIYFEAQEDDRLCNPPAAIDVATALINIARGGNTDFGDDIELPLEWLEEIARHLSIHVDIVHRYYARMERKYDVN